MRKKIFLSLLLSLLALSTVSADNLEAFIKASYEAIPYSLSLYYDDNIEATLDSDDTTFVNEGSYKLTEDTTTGKYQVLTTNEGNEADSITYNTTVVASNFIGIEGSPVAGFDSNVPVLINNALSTSTVESGEVYTYTASSKEYKRTLNPGVHVAGQEIAAFTLSWIGSSYVTAGTYVSTIIITVTVE